MEYKDPGRYIPIIYLLDSWGSRFGVPSRVPLGSMGPGKPGVIPRHAWSHEGLIHLAKTQPTPKTKIVRKNQPNHRGPSHTLAWPLNHKLSESARLKVYTPCNL